MFFPGEETHRLDPTGPRAGKGQLAAKSSLRVWGCCSVTRPPTQNLSQKQAEHKTDLNYYNNGDPAEPR